MGKQHHREIHQLISCDLHCEQNPLRYIPLKVAASDCFHRGDDVDVLNQRANSQHRKTAPEYTEIMAGATVLCHRIDEDKFEVVIEFPYFRISYGPVYHTSCCLCQAGTAESWGGGCIQQLILRTMRLKLRLFWWCLAATIYNSYYHMHSCCSVWIICWTSACGDPCTEISIRQFCRVSGACGYIRSCLSQQIYQ